MVMFNPSLCILGIGFSVNFAFVILQHWVSCFQSCNFRNPSSGSIFQKSDPQCSILSAKTFGIEIIQFIRQPTKSVYCQSQTENHISHSSITTDQSKQIHSSSGQLSVASADQNTIRPSPQGSGISYTENPPTSRRKQISDTNSLSVDLKTPTQA